MAEHEDSDVERLRMVAGSYDPGETMSATAEVERKARLLRLKEEIERAEGSIDPRDVLMVLASICHRTARANGFWRYFPTVVGSSELGALFQRMYLATKIALIHSEGSEALEVLRKAPTTEEAYAGMMEELADTIIRCMDLGHLIGNVNFPGVLLDKMKTNTERPYSHGRAF
jgi:hypothetical protein